VVTVSQRAVIVADQANPVGGFTDAEYAQFGTQFDNLVYPVDEQHFGAPNDIDKNSRVVIFFTSAVNDLTPVGSQQYVGGFFYGRDLFPVAASGAYPGCVGSNEAEMFYMLVPDPARAGGNAESPFAKARVASQTIGVLAHEFQHLINLSRRNLQSDEDVWLNEGLSHIAEELMFYRVSGLQSRANITITQIASGAPQGQAFSDYQNANFNRLNGYLRNPETNSPYADNDSLTTRGATWQMLRYLVDRKGGDQATTLRALVGTQQVGLRNLRTVFGEDPLALVRDYTVAVYADDASFVSSGNLAARYEQPSWNYRAIFPRYTNNNNQFPLKVRTLSTAPVSFPLAAGGAAYLRFAVPANGTATITTTTGNGAAVPTTLQMTLLRTK
jgi:hypothetical protein